MTDDILAAIDARLADLAVDEQLALAATQGPWEAQPYDDNPGDEGSAILAGVGIKQKVIAYSLPYAWHSETECDADAAHIARHDPATVLERVRRERAACEADKALLAEMRLHRRHGPTYYLREATLRALRARYLDGER